MGQKLPKERLGGMCSAIELGQADYIDPIVTATNASTTKTLKSRMKLWKEVEDEEEWQMQRNLIQIFSYSFI